MRLEDTLSFMPFVGKRYGEFVGPYDVEDGSEVQCPQCGGTMGVKATYKQGSKIISRHFFHKSSSDCSGESDAHIKLKTIAKSTLDRPQILRLDFYKPLFSQHFWPIANQNRLTRTSPYYSLVGDIMAIAAESW